MREANKRLWFGRFTDWILCANCVFALWGGEVISSTMALILSGVLVAVLCYQIILTRRQVWTVRNVLRFFEDQSAVDGLYVTAHAAECAETKGRKAWEKQVQEKAYATLQHAPVPLPKRTVPRVGISVLFATVALLLSTWLTSRVGAPPDPPQERTVSAVVADLGIQEDRLRVVLEQLEAVEAVPADGIISLQRVLEALADIDTAPKSRDAKQIEEARAAVEEALPLTGAAAMSSVLAQMGEAAEYSVPETLEQIQSDLDDLEQASQNEEESEESKRREPEASKNPPPEEMKPSDEPSDDAEEGEGEEQVLARAEADGEGERKEGDGAAPSEFLDESSTGAGTVQMDGSMGEDSVAAKPSQAEGGSAQNGDALQPLPLTQEEAWVRAEWEGDAVGLTRAIELMGEGRLAAAEREEVRIQFTRVAEAALRKDNIPPARAALIRDYFKLLAEDSEK